MNTIYYITNFMGALAGFLCVAMICTAIFKIITGDEGEHRKYQARIKHDCLNSSNINKFSQKYGFNLLSLCSK